MLRTFILALLALFLCSSFSFHTSIDPECLANIRVGKFKTISHQGREILCEIKRSKNKQIESYNFGKTKIISRVKWLSPTRYTLTTLKHVNINPGCDEIGAVATIDIIACDGDYYTYRWTQKGCGSGEGRYKKL
ncbi:MAG: hypothetical protein AAFN10_29000 [Bacteroidota bacterium]